MDKTAFLNINPVSVRLYDKKDIVQNKYEYFTNNLLKDLKYKEVIIKFPVKFLEQTDKNKAAGSVFSKKNTSEYQEDITHKDNVYEVKHMNLLPYTTVEEFKYIIASVLKIDFLDILGVFPDKDREMEFVDEIDKEKCKGYYWSHNNEKLTDYNAYQLTNSIGYNKLIVNVAYDGKQINVNYEYKFYNVYTKRIQYINNITKNSKANLTRDIIINNSGLQNVEVLLINGSKSPDVITNINIIKLFSSLHTSINLKKILINDSLLTAYNLEDRETQYVKTPQDIKDGFKNTFSRFNCCSVYTINEIVPGIILSRIEIYREGFIKCCFMINDPDLQVGFVKETMREYFKKEVIEGELKQTGKFWKLFSKLNISESIYNLNYKDIDMIPIYHNISYIIMLDNVKAKNFKGAFNLVDQETPSMVYSTNTSVYLSSYSTIEAGGFYNYYYSRGFHALVTDNTLKTDILSHIHLQAQDDNSIVCYISRCYNEDDLIMNSLLVLPLFDIDFNKKIVNNDFENLPLEQKVKFIRDKYKKIPTKKAIKKLNESDPVLFDNRYINEKESRPYSALAQKKEQRVVVVTKQEYDIISEQNSEFVSDIRNQTQGGQRLYLFCPFEKFPYINFHHYHNQLCIPKCTTNITKRNQFLFCNNQLDARNITNEAVNDLSKMIVYYSPLLAPGRKCKPPEELWSVCENNILFKLDSSTDIYDYCMDNYNVKPFIITRDNINKQYITNSEIEYGKDDYILVIQSELDSLFYIVLSENTYKPYILSEHKEMLTFLKSIQLNKNIGYNLFNFIDGVFKLNLAADYENKTFTEILNMIYDKYKLIFISDLSKTTIIGVMKDNILLFTPFLSFDTNVMKIETKSINYVINTCQFPTIDMFNEELVSRYYKDYETGQVTVINYNNVDVIIQPIDPNYIFTFKDVILFDYEAFINTYKFIASGKKREKNYLIYRTNTTLETMTHLLIYIYYNTYEFVSFDVEEFIKILKDVGLVTDKETNIKYDQKTNSISWRTSVVNETEIRNVLAKINFEDVVQLTDIVYNELTDTMNIYNHDSLDKINMKIITNNTV